jgi:putative transposase
MKRFTFSRGRTLQIDGQPFKVASRTDDGQFELMTADGAIIPSTQDDLLQKYAQRRLSFVESDATTLNFTAKKLSRPLSTFPETIQAEAIRRKKYIDFILQYGPFVSSPKSLAPLIAMCAESIKDTDPPSASSIYRWKKKLICAQYDTRSLIGRSDLRGKAGSRLPEELKVMLEEAIDQVYLNLQCNTIEETWSYLDDLVANANEFREKDDKLRTPSISTVRRAVRSLDQFDALVARKGQRIASMRFRTSGRGPQASRILERVEIDHTPLDLFVICNKTHLPMGRPTITLAIDKFSRMVVGIHIGFEGPSIEAVFACLRHAILPKSDLKSEYPEIVNTWPCYGAIEELICDNGLEFHALELERVAFETSMILTFCPTRAPYYKGSVERFLKTVNYKFAHGLPGTSFARWFHREDYDSQKQAVIPFDVLRAILFRWIVDVYSQSIHRGIGTTPYAKWMEGAQQFTPALPISPERLDIALGRTCERTLSHAGIELFNVVIGNCKLTQVGR